MNYNEKLRDFDKNNVLTNKKVRWNKEGLLLYFKEYIKRGMTDIDLSTATYKELSKEYNRINISSLYVKLTHKIKYFTIYGDELDFDYLYLIPENGYNRTYFYEVIAKTNNTLLRMKHTLKQYKEKKECYTKIEKIIDILENGLQRAEIIKETFNI